MNHDAIATHPAVQIASRTEEFILPCLLLIGTTCNTLTFMVMRRGRMRHSSSCFYMAALAMADTFVLWIGCLNRWLELLDKPRPILACNLCCKFGTFAFFFFADCSVWITVAMTFERYIAVSQPLRASQLCTIKRARYILLLVVAIFFLINAHFLGTFHLTSNPSHCIPRDEQSVFLKYFTWFDSFKYSFCPFTLLITLNVLIIKSLLNARNATKLLEQQTTYTRKTMDTKSSLSSSSTSTNNSGKTLAKPPEQQQQQLHISTKALAYRRVNRRLTTMLLTVSFAFCICSMPISIMQIIDAIYADVSQRSLTLSITITIGKIIAEISQYVNHSSNFFLYAFTGRVFRHELRRLFACQRHRFFASSSQRLRHRAKKLLPHCNPSQGVHEHFYSHGKRHTRILIAPKHLLSPPQNDAYQQSMCSTYSLSQVPITRHNSPYDIDKYPRLPMGTQTTSVMLLEPSLCATNKQRPTLSALIDKLRNDQTEPLLTPTAVQPYGFIDCGSTTA